jgi:hypothetical protein
VLGVNSLSGLRETAQSPVVFRGYILLYLLLTAVFHAGYGFWLVGWHRLCEWYA